MKKFAFVSRHVPTDSQVRLAEEQGIVLHHIGDADGFTVNGAWVRAQLPDARGAIVVHAGAALRLITDMDVGVFNNVNRAPVGEPPSFESTELHVFWQMRVDGIV